MRSWAVGTHRGMPTTPGSPINSNETITNEVASCSKPGCGFQGSAHRPRRKHRPTANAGNRQNLTEEGDEECPHKGGHGLDRPEPKVHASSGGVPCRRPKRAAKAHAPGMLCKAMGERHSKPSRGCANTPCDPVPGRLSTSGRRE